MQTANPAGTDGFAFLEFATNDAQKLITQFETMGFTPYAKHNDADVIIYKQNDIYFLINTTRGSLAEKFSAAHGASASAMGFRVKDADAAFEYTVQNGAMPYQAIGEKAVYDVPAIYGIGGSLIYFVDEKNGMPNYMKHFTLLPEPPVKQKPIGLTYLDHVTHNLHRGNMAKWADFYTNLFGFREIRYFDIEGRMTGLKSKAMTSACGKIRIPLNESSDNKSQIEEFLHDFNGEGIQHIALGSDNIYESVDRLDQNGMLFLDTPDTYYELIDKRLPGHGEQFDELKRLRILVDGTTKDERKLLLQIFTQNMLGPVFFEIIQRKGDEGFGEGNFKALFESIELDQIRRGVLTTEDETS